LASSRRRRRPGTPSNALRSEVESPFSLALHRLALFILDEDIPLHECHLTVLPHQNDRRHPRTIPPSFLACTNGIIRVRADRDRMQASTIAQISYRIERNGLSTRQHFWPGYLVTPTAHDSLQHAHESLDESIFVLALLRPLAQRPIHVRLPFGHFWPRSAERRVAQSMALSHLRRPGSILVGERGGHPRRRVDVHERRTGSVAEIADFGLAPLGASTACLQGGRRG